jgi:DNA protecting protein DprA
MLVRMDLVRACAILARTPRLTAEHVREAVAHFGDLERALGAGRALSSLQLPEEARAWLAAPDTAAIDSDIAWIASSGARLVPCTSADYPPLLAEVRGAPPVLYVLGDPAVLRTPQLAMVGSRNPTPAGRVTARDFAAFFARAGLTITSGLALGIDAASHEGALAAGGLTIAVCGTGLDDVYPRENRTLADRIRERGALVSEFPPRTPPRRENFPQRNRIISGMTLGTLVVEAARRSGALITAKYAGEQGREVFAIPGSIHNPLARGCHQLIRQGAKLVESAGDVLSELHFSFEAQELATREEAARNTATAAPALDKEYEMLLDALGFEPATIDALVARTGLPGESIASMLLILELEGRVALQAGGRYCRIL